jgi:hypothetical protein
MGKVMQKNNQNWQNIDQLPLFNTLIYNMHRDTLFKLECLENSLANPYTILDMDVANIMHALHRQLKNYPVLLEQLDIWKNEKRRPDEIELIDAALALCHDINSLTKECQELAEKVKNITVEARSQIPRYDQESKENILKAIPPTHSYTLTEEQVKRYRNIREMLRDLYAKFVGCLDKETVQRSASRLGILQGNSSLLINTEHESNLFFDYCIYQHKQGDLTGIQRSFKNFAKSYTKEWFEVFEISSKGYFAYLDILDFVEEDGLVVYDRLRDTLHLMVDNGLNKVAKSLHYYTIVTHVMDFKDFLVTTGASTPVPVHTESGLKVQRRFEEYLRLVNNGKVSVKEEKQYITDLYKICLHEDITGKVSSPLVPFGKEELEKRIWLTNTIQ